MLKKKIILTIIIVFTVLFSLNGILSANTVNLSEDISLYLGGSYSFIDPDELNTVISDVYSWSNEIAADMENDIKNDIDNLEYDTNVKPDYSKEPLQKDKINSETGLTGALFYHNVSSFLDNISLQGEYSELNSDMDGNIDADMNIYSEDTSDGEDKVNFKINGDINNSVNAFLRGLSVNINPQLTSSLKMSAGAGYYWGSGNLVHESTLDFNYEPEDSNIANDLNLEEYEGAELNYYADLDFEGSLGTKLGMIYEHHLSDSLSIITTGVYRKLELDVIVNENYNSGGKTEMYKNYLNEEDDFRPPSKFTEDLSGYKVDLGIYYNW